VKGFTIQQACDILPKQTAKRGAVMSVRIIQINKPNEFWEQVEADGYFKLSQNRSGKRVSLKEGDVVFAFVYCDEISNGEVRYRCRIAQINEDIDDGKDVAAKLEIVETYKKGTCTLNHLRDRNYVKLNNFNWNIVPGLIDFMKEANKAEELVKEELTGKTKRTKDTQKNKNEIKGKRRATVKKKEKDVKKKDDIKKNAKKKDTKKKDDKKKDVKKKEDDKKKKK